MFVYLSAYIHAFFSELELQFCIPPLFFKELNANHNLLFFILGGLEN